MTKWQGFPSHRVFIQEIDKTSEKICEQKRSDTSKRYGEKRMVLYRPEADEGDGE